MGMVYCVNLLLKTIRRGLIIYIFLIAFWISGMF